MSQIWEDEKVIPVTVIKAEPNIVNLIREEAKHGYQAVQLAFKSGKKNILREFRISSDNEYKKGDVVDVSIFAPQDKVKVTSRSRGLGFQGVVKRHGFAGAPKTHGTKDQLRASGSIGAGGVGRVFKGTRMAGRTGGDTITVKNMTVITVDKENNELKIKGCVPGHNGSLVRIVKS